MTVPPERRFADALAKAREEWAAADAAASAARAGCRPTEGGVLVPLFGRPHLVTHPGGDVVVVRAGGDAAEQVAPAEAEESARSSGRADLGAPAHIAVAILLLHYLLLADGAAPAGSWSAYRELPGRVVLRGVVRRQGRDAADPRLRRLARRPRCLPVGCARGRRRRAHA